MDKRMEYHHTLEYFAERYMKKVKNTNITEMMTALQCGYTRAAQLLDAMCKAGLIQLDTSTGRYKWMKIAATHYPNSECEKHSNITTSAPVCLLCLIEKLDALEDENRKLREKLNGNN